MTWFKVDDGFYSSKKVMSIPRQQRLAAVGLWTMAGNWSGRELSDGVVPAYVLVELGATPNLRQALVKARLWLDHAEGGIEFHDWSKYQPTRAQVEAERERNAEKQRRWRDKHRSDTDNKTVSHPVTDEGTNPISNDPPTRPDPTRPKDSSTKSPSAQKRGSRIDPGFAVSNDMRDWARQNVPLVDVDKKLPEFIDYWKSVAGEKGVKLDWEATWHNGMRKQQEFALRDGLADLTAPSTRRVVTSRVPGQRPPVG